MHSCLAFHLRRLTQGNKERPPSNSTIVEGSGMVSRTVAPVRENAALNVVPPTMSVPIRSQSGAKFSLRIQLCKSGAKGVPDELIGLDAESQRNSRLGKLAVTG